MLRNAVQWVRDHTIPAQGLAQSSSHRDPGIEVTGYAIPTLRAVGEQALAIQYARWLASIQNADGSLGGSLVEPSYAFDTAQAVRGWVGVLDLLPELETPLRRACDWLLAASDPDLGRLPVPEPGRAWSLGGRGELAEDIHLYCLAPLRTAAALLGEPGWARFVERARDYHLRHLTFDDFTRPNALAHYFALVQAALIELDCHDVARRAMTAAAAHQQASGAIPVYADVAWACSAATAQLAEVWLQLEEPAPAERALAFLASVQHPSGGFFGSYGPGAEYYPSEEISWAVKFVIDACRRRPAAVAVPPPDAYRVRLGPIDAPPLAEPSREAPFPAHDGVARARGANFFRTRFFSDANRALVEACRRHDEAYLARHILAQDEGHPEKFTHELFEHRHGMQAIHALLAPLPRLAVLDVACGNGELLKALARSGHDVAGIDVSPVRVARNRREIPRLQVAVAERVPFASGVFDVVIAQECMEYVMDLDRSLAEVHRLLRTDGLFFCQVPNGDFPDGDNHVRLFTEALLRWCCETAGFEVVSLTRMPYLVGEPPNNLFLVGRKPPAAGDSRDDAAGDARNVAAGEDVLLARSA